MNTSKPWQIMNKSDFINREEVFYAQNNSLSDIILDILGSAKIVFYVLSPWRDRMWCSTFPSPDCWTAWLCEWLCCLLRGKYQLDKAGWIKDSTYITASSSAFSPLLAGSEYIQLNVQPKVRRWLVAVPCPLSFSLMSRGQISVKGLSQPWCAQVSVPLFSVVM